MYLKSHDLSLDAATRRVRLVDRAVKLEPKAFDLLVYLMRNPRRVISKQELLDSLWWGEIVSESVLTRWVSCLRKLLADDARTPRFIRTVHRCGYEFIAPVEIEAEAERQQGPDAPFIGRRAELDRLRVALSMRAETRSNGWLVSGERGVGKTRLLEEAANAATGPLEIHWARASGLDCAPLAFFRRCLRSLVRRRTVKVVATAFRQASRQTRGWLLDAQQQASLEKTTSSRATAAELDELAAGLFELARARPLALIVDDLQASDVASLLLFQRLVVRQQAPIVVLGALRDAELPGEPASSALASLRVACRNQIVLRPFDTPEVAEFIQPWTSAAQLAEQLVTRTGGNPRFLSLLSRAERLGARNLPEGVRLEVRERLAVLPRETLALLRRVCVSDVDLTVSLLTRVCRYGASDCERWLEPALAARLLVKRDDRRLSFAHGVVREVLYDELEPEYRCGAHLALWSALAETVDESNPRLSGLLRAGARHVAAARDCLMHAQRVVEAGEVPAMLWATTSSLGS